MNSQNNEKAQLEDNHEDIIAKAMRGLKIGKNEIAQRIGIEKNKIESVLSGNIDKKVIQLIALELDLNVDSLLISAEKSWFPLPQERYNIKQFNLTFGNMKVNTYLVWSLQTKEAWLFDSGPDSNPIVQFLQEKCLEVSAVFLTHTHRDHIHCLGNLLPQIKNPQVFVHEEETLEGATAIQEGFQSSITGLKLVSLHTHGHSAGGTTYLIEGLGKPVAIVGDALFAGSMGGGMISYEDALRTNREKIMTLPNETILCPGHGPMTTIAEEKQYNPFFPEF